MKIVASVSLALILGFDQGCGRQEGALDSESVEPGAMSTEESSTLLLSREVKSQVQIEGGGDIEPLFFTPDAKINFRFLAAFGSQLATSTVFVGQCGGALIDDQWIVTASHCSRYRWVLLGQRNLAGSGGELREIAAVNSFCRKDRNPDTLDNDIALIKVPRMATSEITPIRRIENDSWETSSASTRVILAGWGEGSKSIADKVEVPVMEDRKLCEKSFTDNGSKIKIQDTTFCTVAIKKGALSNDSGGPVVIERNGQFVLVGIMSARGGQTAKGFPNKHVRISRYKKWIDDVMRGVPNTDTGACPKW